MKSTRSNLALAAILLAAASIAVYLPIFHGGFIWDDNNFLTGNALIHAPDGLRRFWLTTEAADYWPLTSTTLWLEWRIWGPHAAGYHVTNVLLHAFEAVLLWSVLRRLRMPGAFLGALLFAVHPVNVETVAWITQRKNLMAMFFYLLSIRFFLETAWADQPRPTSGRRLRFAYGLSLLSYILALLAKGSVAPLPLVLLGCVAWKRRPTWADLVRVGPYLGAAVFFTLLNIALQAHDYAGFRKAGWLERSLGAGAALWFYLAKAIFPVGLSFVYPHWTISIHDPAWWLPLLAALAVTGWAAWLSGRPPGLARGWSFAWGYYGALLLPVLGFTDVGFMKFSLVADHYQHLAVIGVTAFVAAAVAVGRARVQASLRPATDAASGLVVVVLGSITFLLSGTYADARTLYEHTLQHSPRSSLAHNNLGIILARNPANAAAAEHHYALALEADPGMAEAHYNLAILLARFPDRRGEAIAQGEEAVRLNPGLTYAHIALGNLLATQPGRLDQAVREYETALRQHPEIAEAHYDLANALASTPEHLPEAISEYRQAIALNPADGNAENNLANALASLPGKQAEAIEHFEAAIRLNPESIQAHNNLANVLAMVPGRAADAVAQYQAALTLDPTIAQIHLNLANVLATIPGRTPEAATQFEEALQLDPGLAEARRGLETLRAPIR